MRTLMGVASLTVLLITNGPAGAVTLTGGGPVGTDCWTGFEVTSVDADIESTTAASLTARAHGDACTFHVQACVGLAEPTGCTPRSLRRLRARPRTLALPATLGPERACGPATDVVVTMATHHGETLGSQTIRLVGKARRRLRDKDVVRLVCQPHGDPPCTGTCGANPEGGPDHLVFTVADSGTDLDNGWSGNSHNFPLVPNAKLDLCLSGCDGGSDTVCDACGAVGAGTPNGTSFGAPLPLFASNVPVCIVSRWREPIRGTVDEATGDTSLGVKLSTDVFLTDATAVCPQCEAGKCTSGANAGQACTVEATLPVYVSSTRTDRYDLSSTCVPSSPTATLRIDFDPLTSGSAAPLAGPTPCVAQAGDPRGVPPKADACGGSLCGSACTGRACVAQAADPTRPGETVCVDSKGGTSQLCCDGNTQQPCFPLANGGQIVRTGIASPPQPALPDPSYPKTQRGVLASTFCIPATGTNTIDSVTGLPGPGAILLNGVGEWSKAEGPGE